jgi:plasmid stabilization system protein ParE
MRDELSPGLRCHPAGSHIIYYWVVEEALIVAHILHSRQDVERETWTKPETPRRTPGTPSASPSPA